MRTPARWLKRGQRKRTQRLGTLQENDTPCDLSTFPILLPQNRGHSPRELEGEESGVPQPPLQRTELTVISLFQSDSIGLCLSPPSLTLSLPESVSRLLELNVVPSNCTFNESEGRPLLIRENRRTGEARTEHDLTAVVHACAARHMSLSHCLHVREASGEGNSRAVLM